MTRPTFNLIDEPWLPVTRRDGTKAELGLKAVLTHAHELARLELDTPDVIAGVWKLLLAILHRVYQGPEDLKAVKAIWKAGHFSSSKVNAYLGEWASRFDLWDPKHPFLQDPKLEGESSSLSRLFVECAKGNNATLFDHTQDSDLPVIPVAAVARALVGAQHFALGGRIEGAKDSAVGNPSATAAFMLLLGESVFETLCLNLCVYDKTRPIPSTAKDSPSWEQDIAKASRRRERGYLDLLTWRPRRYRLVMHDEAGREVGGLIAQGEADRFEDSETFLNPLCGYRISKTAGLLEVRINPEKAIWRESPALLSSDDSEGRRPEPVRQVATLISEGVLPRAARFNLLAAGFATDKAKVKLARVESFVVPGALLSEPVNLNHLREGLRLADEVERAVRGAVFICAKRALTAGDRSPDTESIAALARSTGAETTYWAGLGTRFGHYLLELPDDPEQAQLSWRATLRAAALDAFRQADVKLANSPLGLRAVVDAKRNLLRDLAEHCPTATQEKSA